jgi:hypothetical protein
MRWPVMKHGFKLWLACWAMVMLAAVPSMTQAETCYRDESGRIVHRRQPGFKEVPCPTAAPPSAAGTPNTPGNISAAPAAPDIEGPESNSFPGGRRPPVRLSPLPRPQVQDFPPSETIPDRWQVVEQLPGYAERKLDPYNRNLLKADRPISGDWFFNLGLISDSAFQMRDIPAAVGGSSTRLAGENDVFGKPRQRVFAQNLATEFVLYKGDTVFMPPQFEFRATPVFNYNRLSASELGLVNVDPRRGTQRSDHFVGLEELFGEFRLNIASPRFDFDSVRIGIQPFNADFRGFLFQDNQLGVRLFGTRDNNRIQYNVGWFRMLEKDTNSGLNSVTEAPRHNDIFVANVYRQDTPTPGFTSQLTVVYNRDREAGVRRYDTNGFLVIPAALGLEQARNYDVVYLGYNGDGHFGRLNLTTSLYAALGKDERGTFVDRSTRIRAGFAAAELSRDFSWLRARLSLLYATGDEHPHGNTESGFDAIFENPQFAGADTSYWIGQAVPLIGGGGVSLSQSNSVLNSLRSSKDEGQSNFANPGTGLAGLGVDADVLPVLRLSANLNDLYFATTQVLEVARNQGGIERHLGEEASVAATWRPLDTQNIILRAAYAHLFPGAGYRQLFPRRSPSSVLFNVTFTY